MDRTTLINKLQDDLSREYSHWHFYINASITVTGLHREELSEFFLTQAQSEMLHIQQWAKLILGLGVSPMITCNNLVTSELSAFYYSPKTPKELLEYALNMEKEVVNNFVQRMDECDELENVPEDKTDARWVHLFLEDQLMDSRADVDNINEMLKGL